MTTDTAPRSTVDSLEISKEIEIAAPIEIAFEAMLDQLGVPPDARDFADLADETGAVARRPMVPRSRRGRGPSLGARAGDQSADAA